MADDVTSAIDDSGATQAFGRPPPITRSDAGSGPISFEYGRRSGHWTAGDTVFGSAIDDECATVIHLPGAYGGGGESGQVQPLSSVALKKLKRSSEEAEKKKAATRAEEEAREKEKAAAAVEQRKDLFKAKAPPRAFYVPKRGPLGIKIVSKDGKSEVVMRPQPVARSTVQASKPKTGAPLETAPAPVAVPEALRRPAPRVPSTASQPVSATHRRVRIVGKNGEEAFVALPTMQTTSKPKSDVYVPAGVEGAKTKMAGPPASAPKEDIREDKAQQEQKATKLARELCIQRERQEKEEQEQRERQAKAVADVLMSGGLLGSRNPSRAANPASMHTAKSASSSSASVLNGAFRNTSRAPSNLSSSTMTPPPAQVASVRAASQASSQRAKTVSMDEQQLADTQRAGSQKTIANGGWAADGGNATAHSPPSRGASAKTTSQTPSQRSKAPSREDWLAIGSSVKRPRRTAINDSWEGTSAIYKTPSAAPQPSLSQRPPPRAASRQKASTPPSRPASIMSSQISRKIAGIHRWNNATPSLHSRLPSHHDQPSSAHTPALRAIDTRRTDNASQDTIFAGTGWISPHPLSRAPTEFEPPPQDKISIQGATMTYEEWKRLHKHTNVGGEMGRRNFSRPSSGGKTVRVGTWGHGAVPASLGGAVDGSGGAGSGGSGWGPDFHVPTVISEHSQRSRQSYHNQHSASLSHLSREQSVRTSIQRSGASSGGPSTQKSFNDSFPGVGFRHSRPQVDGAGSYSAELGRTWRELGRSASPLVFSSTRDEDGEGGSRREPMQLSMPWDREAVVGGEVGRW